MQTTQMKPFDITKRMVWDAYKLVKRRKGSAGVDEQSLHDFDRDLENNLYKLWNRLSSGSYFPPPVLRVEIPKRDGGTRPLGIPTVSDRIAQMVVKLYLEPKIEPYFHEDSYGYRPGKSALEAVGVARKRCWRNDFVLDVDIKGFFDSINHELLMKAVTKHTDCKWVLMYIERWLKAPVQFKDGSQEARQAGTPQGGVVSPLLANLYLHYAFDVWMKRNYPGIPFERYADDIVIHCRSEAQSQLLLRELDTRLRACFLTLHPEKTKIVYCKDSDRCNTYPCHKFVFLGFEFRPRGAKNRSGKLFVSFLPAVSPQALKEMRRTVRAWRLKWCIEKTPEDLSRMFNPFVRGWVNYYGRFYKSALFGLACQLNLHLAAWASQKYRRCRRKPRKARRLVGRIADRNPRLFAHWDLLGYRFSSDGKRRAV